MIAFMLLCNAVVLVVCVYYLLSDDVIELGGEEGVVIRLPGAATGRMLGTLPFILSFFYLTLQLWKARPDEARLDTLDTPVHQDEFSPPDDAEDQ